MSKQTDLLNLTDAITVDSSNNVGIGTTSPNVQLKLEHANRPSVALKDLSTNDELYMTVENDIAEFNAYTAGTGARVPIVFTQYTDERMRIDSSGNLLVGKTSTSSASAGVVLQSSGLTLITRDAATPMSIRRNTSNGNLLAFTKDGADTGSLQTRSNNIRIGKGDVGLEFHGADNTIYPANMDTVGLSDNHIDLGGASYRFDDIYATNGTIQTSDRNEKQDIEALSDAEQRVAVACKGLLRKFRWIDAVAEKGDDARIHFGIIAQDLQDAFAAEGLDAGRYAMFISTTWWETQTEVPAVEADEENGIEAKEAYTRTDTYETLEEAPEGATERTRLGVRYPELLAFIIGAM